MPLIVAAAVQYRAIRAHRDRARARSMSSKAALTPPSIHPPPQSQNFGARDPTAGEIASNFGDKVLGNWDTEHIIK